MRNVPSAVASGVPERTRTVFRVFLFTCGTLEPVPAQPFDDIQLAVRYAEKLSIQHEAHYQVREVLYLLN